MAASAANYDVVEILLNPIYFGEHMTDINTESVLRCCLANTNNDTSWILTRRLKTFNLLITRQNWCSYQARSFLFEEVHFDLLKCILENNHPKGIQSMQKNMHDENVLHLLATSNYGNVTPEKYDYWIGALEQFINIREYLLCHNKWGMDALEVACRYVDLTDATLAFVESKVCLNETTDTVNKYVHAAVVGQRNQKFLHSIVKRTYGVNAAESCSHLGPLLYTATSCLNKVATNYFLSLNANPNYQNSAGDTPLHSLFGHARNFFSFSRQQRLIPLIFDPSMKTCIEIIDLDSKQEPKELVIECRKSLPGNPVFEFKLSCSEQHGDKHVISYKLNKCQVSHDHIVFRIERSGCQPKWKLKLLQRMLFLRSNGLINKFLSAIDGDRKSLSGIEMKVKVKSSDGTLLITNIFAVEFPFAKDSPKKEDKLTINIAEMCRSAEDETYEPLTATIGLVNGKCWELRIPVHHVKHFATLPNDGIDINCQEKNGPTSRNFAVANSEKPEPGNQHKIFKKLLKLGA